MADCKKKKKNDNNMGLGVEGESFGASAGPEHHHHEELTSGNKYGGLVPKKKPLITKDNARAFFDSADWALCKQGGGGGGAGISQESTLAVETLLPKLQRTPHQQLPPRRPACTSGRDNFVE